MGEEQKQFSSAPADIGETGPQTDKSTADYPAGTTGLDESGQPRDIRGIPTTGAPVAPKPAVVDYAALAKQFGGRTASKGPVDYAAMAREFGGRTASSISTIPGVPKDGLPGVPGAPLPSELRGPRVIGRRADGSAIHEGDIQLRKGGPTINLYGSRQTPEEISAANPIVQLPGEDFSDVMDRAAKSGRFVTKRQIEEEERQNLLAAPGVLATAFSLGAAAPAYLATSAAGVAKQVLVGGDSQLLGHPEELMSEEAKKAHPYVAGSLELAGEFSKPEMLAMMFGGPVEGMTKAAMGNGGKILSRMVSLGFGVDMISNTARQIPEIKDVVLGEGQYKDMSLEDRESLAKKMVLKTTVSGAMATQALEHGVMGETSALTGAGERADARLRSALNPIAQRVGDTYKAAVQGVGDYYAGLADRAGDKITKDAIGTAIVDHMAASDAHTSRTDELQIARQQANAADNNVQKVLQDYRDGKATKEQYDQARTNASEARANESRAEKARLEAAQRAYDSEQNLNRLARRAAKRASGITAIDPKVQGQAIADIAAGIPPTKSPKGNYTAEDMTRSAPYVQEETSKEEPKTIQDIRDGLQNQVDGIDTQLEPVIAKYGTAPIKVNSISGEPATVLQAVLESLQLDQEPLPEGFINKAAEELQKYNLTNITLAEANDLRARLIKENRATMNQNSWNVTDARAKDPRFAARDALYDVLRNGIHNKLDELGVKNSEVLRKDQASLIRLKNAADAAIRAGEVVKKGTAETGPVRKLLAKGAKAAGAAVGAAAGVASHVPFAPEALAAAGAAAGEKIGRVVSPPDLTRNQVAVRGVKALRSANAKPQLDVTGAVAHADHPPVHPLENQPLHIALANYYPDVVPGEVGSGYVELERRFMRDYERKIDMGLKTTATEDGIKAQINEQRFKELDEAQKAADKAIADAQKAAAKTAEEAKAAEAKAAEQPATAEEVKEAEKIAAEQKAEKGDLAVNKAAVAPAEERAIFPYKTTDEELPVAQHLWGKPEYQPFFTRIHELAHTFASYLMNLPPKEVLSNFGIMDRNPGVSPNKLAHASAEADVSRLKNPDGTYNMDKVKANLGDILTRFVIGGVAEEVHGGQKFEDNESLNDDLVKAMAWMHEVGVPAERQTELINMAKDHARELLTQPGVEDLFRQWAEKRIEGTPDSHHFTPEHISEFTKAVDQVLKGGEYERPEGPKEPEGGGGKKPVREGTDVSTAVGRGEKGPKGGIPVAQSVPGSLVEKTTGKAEHDEAIRLGGGIPAGVAFPGDTASEIRLFHDPQTGSTLGFKPGEAVTAEGVRQKMEESRKNFAKTPPAAEPYHPALQQMAEKVAPTDSAEGVLGGASFIAPDGKFMHLGATQHPDAIEFYAPGYRQGASKAQGGDVRIPFINDTKAVRTRFEPMLRQGPRMAITIPTEGVTPEQSDAIRQAVGQAIQRKALVDIGTADRRGNTITLDHPRVSDVQKTLDQLKAQPLDLRTQKAQPFADTDEHRERMAAFRLENSTRPVVNSEPPTPSPVLDRTKIQGGEHADPKPTYHEASAGKDNPWVRSSVDPARNAAPTNKGRQLMVQFSSDLINGGIGEADEASRYYDKLYSGARPGYARMKDFWEIPQWMGFVAHNLPDADVYVVRDMDQAKKFLNGAGYDRVMFSALDVNKNLIRELAGAYNGHVDVGGYVEPGTFLDRPNVKYHPSVESLATDVNGPGTYKHGTDYRHFEGSDVIPRLTMSDGCLHRCAFCAVTKKLTETPESVVDQQADSIAKLGSKLVYLNDKTFGQAKNYTHLEQVYGRMKEKNPQFQGFVVQTTAAQMNKIPADFFKKAGIKYVELGMETYNDTILKEMHKPANEKLIDAATQKLRDAGVALIPNVIIGLPGETSQTYKNTLDFLKRNRDIISHANIYNLALYKDAELGKTVASSSPDDFNENVLEKSFHTNPEIHKVFAGDMYGLAQDMLDGRPEALSLDLHKSAADANGLKHIKDLKSEDLQFPEHWAEKAAEEAKTGGFTYHPETGAAPTEGYMVETVPESRKTHGKEVTPADIRKFAEENKGVLAQHPELHVGGWQNELNVAGRYGSKDAALNAANKLDQKAVWDVANKEEIPAEGKNKRREFPEYPLSERLKDLAQTGGEAGFSDLSSLKQAHVNPKHIEDFRKAVENTPGAKENEDGSITLDLSRHQKPEQEGQQSVRRGVFFVPEENSPYSRYYKAQTKIRPSEQWYGGEQKLVERQVTLKNPLIAKGATGGKIPEKAYNYLMGDSKAYDNLYKSFYDVVKRTGFFRPGEETTVAQVADFLKNNGGNPNDAENMVRNSMRGNQLTLAALENVIAEKAREAGYDAILGFSRHAGEPRLSEVFDVVRQAYPVRGHQEYMRDLELANLAKASDLSDENIKRIQQLGEDERGKAEKGMIGPDGAVHIAAKEHDDIAMGAYNKDSEDLVRAGGVRFATYGPTSYVEIGTDAPKTIARALDVVRNIPRINVELDYSNRYSDDPKDAFYYSGPAKTVEAKFNQWLAENKPNLDLASMGKAAPAPYYLHHITTEDALEAIKKEGLKPGQPYTTNEPNAVHLSAPEGTDFWKNDVRESFGKEPVVLRVNKKGLNLSADKQGSADANAEAFKTGNIPAGKLEIQTPDGWKKLSDYTLGSLGKSAPVPYPENPEGWQHVSKEVLDNLEPDERKFIEGNKRAQRQIQEHWDNIVPSIEETKVNIQAGQALGGWWRRYIDAFNALGEHTNEEVAARLGPKHSDALKLWHAAVSGNKGVEQADKIAWGSYADWLDQGMPRDRKTLDDIVKANGGISDTHYPRGKNKGEVKTGGLDTTKLFKLVNSPEMRQIDPTPMHGDIFDPDRPSPIYGTTSGARKIPSMGATVAGEGNLRRLVLDTHMLDYFGEKGWTDNKYLAFSAHLRQAAKELGLLPGEGQEQLWGTVLGIKQLLYEGLLDKDIPAELTDDVINGIGKDYAQIIKEDPELNGIFERLKAHGIDPGGNRAQQRLAEVLSGKRPKPVEKTATYQDHIANSAARIRSRLKDVPEPSSELSFNFGHNVITPPEGEPKE
jgi:hypothetical protein